MSEWVYLIATPCTGVTLALFYPIETRFMTLGTLKILAIVLIEYVIQTGVVIWEFPVEVFYGIFHSIYTIAYLLLVVKG